MSDHFQAVWRTTQNVEVANAKHIHELADEMLPGISPRRWSGSVGFSSYAVKRGFKTREAQR